MPERAFANQTIIGWLQALICLLYQEWDDIKNQHLQFLGAKTTGQQWIYALITKPWDTLWDVWNYSTCTLYSMDGPSKRMS